MGELLKFDNLGRYKFFKCVECAGPVLGHLSVKCSGQKGEHYYQQTVRSLKEKLERYVEFQQAVQRREVKKEQWKGEIQANKLGEVIKDVLEK